MKLWWLTKGFPWLKENWWALLLLPFMALVAFGALVFRRKLPVIDPMKDADGRAWGEAELRSRAIEEASDKLEKRFRALQVEHEALKVKYEQGLASEVEALRNDPERLRDLMMRTGPGNK
jgi:hypothetical protein